MQETEPNYTHFMPSQSEALPADPYILRRILYTSIMSSLLVLICFYFELTDDNDVLSMVLGFMVCIILQFTFFSYTFKDEMKKLKTDEIGVSNSFK